jgi:hypothetical protein
MQYNLSHRLQPVSGCHLGTVEGLSLVEIMIAVAIFSLGLTAIGAMQLLTINVNNLANATTQIATVVQETKENLLALPYTHTSLQPGTTYTAYIDLQGNTYAPGETPPSPYKYRISWVVTEAPHPGNPTVTLKTIDLSVVGKFGKDKERWYAPIGSCETLRLASPGIICIELPPVIKTSVRSL